MIPSDHFVRFYNEVFKFLDKQGDGALEKYYLEISRHQDLSIWCCLLFVICNLFFVYSFRTQNFISARRYSSPGHN